ncbi:helix-turn-helix transcriptional regulator [Hydrogenophaga sp. SL48]|uniref:helix-turn-helix transcriptional regulator n=1 Tax=Hydrogenophaga sp. SL48 TaxID=2806347 RepID=UPI001F350317|nr:helix-turn-helix transcriptional regulator [Hydrogenophaga sp. SL48]UJW82620.1 helix-turn-helix transcriptional regulator [Hydrogenophaga sp. SL48]
MSTNTDVSDDFKRALFALVHRLMPVDGIRFFIYVPWAQLQQDSASHAQLDTMLRQYAETWWEVDPMHPSRFEDRDTVVVSNSMLMSDDEWRQSTIYTGFYQPSGYFHDCDVFFRQQGRIVAVLSMVRRDPAQPFSPAEVASLNQIQPFVEYSLGAIHVASRVISRTSLSARFHLTARELDVVEIAVTGISNKALCRHLGISLPTLRSHVQNIYAKVGVRSSSELIAKLAPIQFS